MENAVWLGRFKRLKFENSKERSIQLVPMEDTYVERKQFEKSRKLNVQLSTSYNRRQRKTNWKSTTDCSGVPENHV